MLKMPSMRHRECSMKLQERRRLRGLCAPSWYLNMEEESGVRADAGPFGHDFTENGTVGVVEGKLGYAASFDGIEGNYLSRPDSPRIKLGTVFTITGWVWMNEKSSDMAFFSKYASSDFNFDLILTYQLNDNPGSYGGDWYKNQVNPDRIRVHCNGQTHAGGQDFRTVFYANTFGSPPINTWLFIAFRVRPNRMELSINNTGWDALALPNSAGMNGIAPMIIGANEDGSLPLNGCVDECAKFPYFLSDYQIARLYDDGAGKTFRL